MLIAALLFLIVVGFVISAFVSNLNKAERRYETRRRVNRLRMKGLINEEDFDYEDWKDVDEEELDEIEGAI